MNWSAGGTEQVLGRDRVDESSLGEVTMRQASEAVHLLMLDWNFECESEEVHRHANISQLRTTADKARSLRGD